MSRRNRNNRYNSRSRNKWDEGYDDEYFDDDDQLESEEDDSSEDQDEYEDEDYEDDEYEDEEYDEDSDDEYDDEDDEESEDEDEEEYDEDDEDVEEYDEEEEEEEEEEEVDEEEEEEEDDEDDDDDELESEITAAAESTAKKSLGNSDLLNKLRGQLRPQMKEDSSNSGANSGIEISPLSLFGQPIVTNGNKNNPSSKGASSVPPQHANAKIVQNVSASPRGSAPAASAPVQKSGSGRVITAQSLNGANVSSVQPRDLDAEKAEAERRQKEKERLEKEKREKEEKSNRVLDKYKGKRASAGSAAVDKTKAGVSWLWSGIVRLFSKISSGTVWILGGIAAGLLWLFWTKPKQAWQTWRVFRYSWWSGIGTGVWNFLKKPFVTTSAAAAGEGSADGSAPEPVSAPEAAPAPNSSKRKSRKKKVDIWDADPSANPGQGAEPDVFASKEPDSRRRLYWSLSSIGAAAVTFLLVLPAALNGGKRTDENVVAANGTEVAPDGQNGVASVPVVNVNNPGVNGGASGTSGMNNRGSGIANPQLGVQASAPRFTPTTGAPNNHYPSSPQNSPRTYGGNQPAVPTAYSDNLTPPSLDNAALGVTAPEMTSPAVPETGYSGSDMSVPEMPALEMGTLEVEPTVPDLGADAEFTTPELEAPELTTPEVDMPEAPAVEMPEIPADEMPEAPAVEMSEIPAEEMTTPDVSELEAPVPDLSIDDDPVPDNQTLEVPAPEAPELEAPQPEAVVPDAPSADVSVPEIPEVEYDASSDPYDAPAPDVPAEPAADLTPGADDQAPSVTEPDDSVPATPVELDDMPEPEVDVPEIPMPEISDAEPSESVPVETPSAPEPSIPEPAELTPIDTAVASDLPNPELTPEPPQLPESGLPNDSQIAAAPAENPVSSSADPSVDLGTPGPLVSSTNVSQPQTPNVVTVVPNTYNDSPSADAGNGTNGYNNSYNNGGYYNNSVIVRSDVYTVQPNDSFWTIAQRLYGSGEYARALAEYNSSRVSPQSLTVSTQIMTPPIETLEQRFPELCPARSATASVPPASAGSVPEGTRVYIVDQEESVMEIARRELGSILYCSQVYALNQETLSGSVDRVKPGVRLLLPVRK